jgi:hypothetical protein
MTWRDGDEAMLNGLAELRPDPSRAARVRALCCGELERRSRRSHRASTIAAFGHHVAAPLVMAALSAVYATALVETVAGVFKR